MSATPSPTPIYASITVNATNNSGLGNITFNMLDFLEGSMLPGGFPPTVMTTLADGATGTILQSFMQQEISVGTFGPVENPAPCNGTAVFNLPGGQPLTITWNLNAYQGGSMPTIVPGTGYVVSGVSNPQINGFNYTFNITITGE